MVLDVDKMIIAFVAALSVFTAYCLGLYAGVKWLKDSSSSS